MTNEEAVVLALKETVRYGMFLGTFAGTYVSVDECIAALWGRKSKVEVIIIWVNCWSFYALDGAWHAAYQFGNIHSHACCRTCIPLWNKEQKVWKDLQTFDLVTW